MQISEHAIRRARERMSWNRDAVTRMAERAFNEGLCHGEANGRLRRYIGALWTKNRSVDNIRIYGETLFFFAEDRLVTVYRLPNEFIKIAQRLLQRRRSERIH